MSIHNQNPHDDHPTTLNVANYSTKENPKATEDDAPSDTSHPIDNQPDTDTQSKQFEYPRTELSTVQNQ